MASICETFKSMLPAYHFHHFKPHNPNCLMDIISWLRIAVLMSLLFSNLKYLKLEELFRAHFVKGESGDQEYEITVLFTTFN